MKRRPKASVYPLVMTGMMAAVIAVTAPFAIPVQIGEVVHSDLNSLLGGPDVQNGVTGDLVDLAGVAGGVRGDEGTGLVTAVDLHVQILVGEPHGGGTEIGGGKVTLGPCGQRKGYGEGQAEQRTQPSFDWCHNGLLSPGKS